MTRKIREARRAGASRPETTTPAPTVRRQAPVLLDLNDAAEKFALTFTNPSGKRNTIFVSVDAGALGRAKELSSAIGKLAKDIPALEGLVGLAQRVKRDAAVMQAMYDVLASRRAQPEEPKINTPGVPTQALVDAFLSSGKQIEDEGARAARKFKEKYGIDVEELLS